MVSSDQPVSYGCRLVDTLTLGANVLAAMYGTSYLSKAISYNHRLFMKLAAGANPTKKYGGKLTHFSLTS